jgi:hypothetical protein
MADTILEFGRAFHAQAPGGGARFRPRFRDLGALSKLHSKVRSSVAQSSA